MKLFAPPCVMEGLSEVSVIVPAFAVKVTPVSFQLPAILWSPFPGSKVPAVSVSPFSTVRLPDAVRVNPGALICRLWKVPPETVPTPSKITVPELWVKLETPQSPPTVVVPVVAVYAAVVSEPFISTIAVPPFKLPKPETFPNTLKVPEASKVPAIFTSDAVSASPEVTLSPGWKVEPDGTYRIA